MYSSYLGISLQCTELNKGHNEMRKKRHRQWKNSGQHESDSVPRTGCCLIKDHGNHPMTQIFCWDVLQSECCRLTAPVCKELCANTETHGTISLKKQQSNPASHTKTYSLIVWVNYNKGSTQSSFKLILLKQ